MKGLDMLIRTGKKVRDLIDALGIKQAEHIAIVGAGGKTTLMFELARVIREMGASVITSTTTKVWQHQAEMAPQVILTEQRPEWKDKLRNALSAHGHAFVGSKKLPEGKIQGISTELADALYQEGMADYLLVEADGAAGKPVKAPNENEPQVPESATLVVGLIGADALGKPCTPDTVFRLDNFLEITGARERELLTPALLARLVHHDRGIFKGSAENSRRVLFLNRMDALQDTGLVEEFLCLVAGPQGMVIGSLKKGQYLVQ